MYEALSYKCMRPYATSVCIIHTHTFDTLGAVLRVSDSKLLVYEALSYWYTYTHTHIHTLTYWAPCR